MNAILSIVLVLAMQGGNPPAKTVWDGVFTQDQQYRGEDLFNANCRGCHNRDENLAGGEAHALKGEVWFDRWREDSLQSLFNKMKASMPPARNRLADNEYTDIITFLLSQNGFPAGSQELKSTELRSVRVQGKAGPQPLPNLSLVKVIGCVTPAPNNNWNLTTATTPVRTRDPDTSTAEEIQASEATPPGNVTYQLRALDGLANFTPEPNSGKKVQAKGVIYTTQNPNRLTLISVEVLKAACSQ